MEFDSEALEQFLSALRDKLRHSKRALQHKDAQTWDVRARQLFCDAVIRLLRENYGMAKNEVIRRVFVEGLNPLPMEKGKKGGTIFGSNLYPDAIVVTDDGHKTAVELDHGTKGSQIKDALAKKAMLKLVGDFDTVVVFFFLYEPLSETNVGEMERKVIQFYEKNLSTHLLFV
jgi:hypothetical protein